MKRLLKWLYLFLSVVSFVVFAVLCQEKMSLLILALFLSASFLFFGAWLKGGKGAVVVAGIIVFIACIHSFAWLASQAPSFKRQGFSESVIFFGTILGLAICFILPFKIGGWLFPKEKKSKEKETKEKEKEAVTKTKKQISEPSEGI